MWKLGRDTGSVSPDHWPPLMSGKLSFQFWTVEDPAETQHGGMRLFRGVTPLLSCRNESCHGKTACTGRVAFKLMNCWIFCHLARDNAPLKTTTSSKVPGQKDNKQANVALAASQTADIKSCLWKQYHSAACRKSSMLSSNYRPTDRITAFPGGTCSG